MAYIYRYIYTCTSKILKQHDDAKAAQRSLSTRRFKANFLLNAKMWASSRVWLRLYGIETTTYSYRYRYQATKYASRTPLRNRSAKSSIIITALPSEADRTAIDRRSSVKSRRVETEPRQVEVAAPKWALSLLGNPKKRSLRASNTNNAFHKYFWQFQWDRERERGRVAGPTCVMVHWSCRHWNATVVGALRYVNLAGDDRSTHLQNGVISTARRTYDMFIRIAVRIAVPHTRLLMSNWLWRNMHETYRQIALSVRPSVCSFVCLYIVHKS